jgi:hypothetical protein
MLPVEFDGITLESSAEAVSDKPIKLELTSAGRASPLLRLLGSGRRKRGALETTAPIYFAARVSRPKPAAEVLLTDPDPSRESRFGRMPCVALQQYGLGTCDVRGHGQNTGVAEKKQVGGPPTTRRLWGQDRATPFPAPPAGRLEAHAVDGRPAELHVGGFA